MPRRLKELFESASMPKKKKGNKFRNEPGLLTKLNQVDSDDDDNVVGTVPREDESGALRGVKLRPENIKQGPYESSGQFMRRLNKLATNAKFEAVIEQRFNVDLCPTADGLPRKPQILSTVDGSVFDEAMEKKGKKSGSNEEPTVPNKVLKRRIRDQKRRMKKKGNKRPLSGTSNDGQLDFDDYVDNVRFGEVAQRPPSLAKFKRLKKS